NEVHVWDFLSGKEIRQLVVPSDEQDCLQEPYDYGIGRLAFTHDSQTLATVNASGKAIRIWDIQSGKERAVTGPLLSGWLAAFSPDDSILATASGNLIRLWDTALGQEKKPSQGHQGPV